MLNLEKYGNFKSTGKNKKKKQIILSHTSREVEDYLTSLEFRYNMKYDKVPNFIITREGKILQLLPETDNSNFFTNPVINNNAIIIVVRKKTSTKLLH
jgi:hypothetical protein